jgi:opacity protein-like surface antigen
MCSLVRPTYRVALAGLILCCFSGLAAAKDEDDSHNGSAKAGPTLPNLYLDLRTTYATVPANTLSIGLGNSALFAMLPRLPVLPTSPILPVLPTLPTVSSPSSQSIGVDLPLTVDLNDRLSVYGGISGTTSRTELSDWSDFAITSWNVGFQADVYQQNGGSIPTLTLQSTVTRSIPDSLLATTSVNSIAELDYALNEDETRGLLAGVQYTRVFVDSALATVNPNIVGYVGGYYQWDNNWKFTGRVGVQSFGGAQIFSLTPFQPFTQPIVRLDLDRMDDNDNRLFGVTAQIAWVPKPSYQVTLRTPLYAIRN